MKSSITVASGVLAFRSNPIGHSGMRRGRREKAVVVIEEATDGQYHRIAASNGLAVIRLAMGRVGRESRAVCQVWKASQAGARAAAAKQDAPFQGLSPRVTPPWCAASLLHTIFEYSVKAEEVEEKVANDGGARTFHDDLPIANLKASIKKLESLADVPALRAKLSEDLKEIKKSALGPRHPTRRWLELLSRSLEKYGEPTK